MADLETWKNVSRGKRGITRIDPYGKRSSELVPPGKTVKLSKEERLHYQRNAANEELDIFQNGALVPVTLIDEADIAEFASNPNLLSDEELTNLFKLQWKKFEVEVSKISNIYALERMVEFANESEDVTVKKFDVVKTRLADIKESAIAASPSLKSIRESSKRNNRDSF